MSYKSEKEIAEAVRHILEEMMEDQILDAIKEGVESAFTTFCNYNYIGSRDEVLGAIQRGTRDAIIDEDDEEDFDCEPQCACMSKK